MEPIMFMLALCHERKETNKLVWRGAGRKKNNAMNTKNKKREEKIAIQNIMQLSWSRKPLRILQLIAHESTRISISWMTFWFIIHVDVNEMRHERRKSKKNQLEFNKSRARARSLIHSRLAALPLSAAPMKYDFWFFCYTFFLVFRLFINLRWLVTFGVRTTQSVLRSNRQHSISFLIQT